MNEQQGYLCPGFACKSGESRPCYTGPDSTERQGPCKAGSQFCIDNTWKPCQGEVKPEPERCNEVDDDCDGRVDEGVLCVSTLAGGSQGYANGLGRIARFHEPRGLAIDKEGDLYISDTKNHRIRKLEFRGDVDIEVRVQLWAGTGEAKHVDGFRTTRAAFHEPRGITIDPAGNLYIADSLNDAIRVVNTGDQVSTLTGGMLGTCKDTQGKAITWNEPTGLALGPQGSLWISDTQNHVLRKLSGVEQNSCEASLVVGDGLCQTSSQQCYRDGAASQSQWYDPSGMVSDAGGNVYVADYNNNMIRKIDNKGHVTTIAGGGSLNPGFKDGKGTAARFNFPRGITLDSQGNLFVADTDNHAIRKIDKDRNVTTLVGKGKAGFQDGDGQSAQLNSPWALVVGHQGNLFVADTKNHRIRKVTFISP